jgi:hypothetical protein
MVRSSQWIGGLGGDQVTWRSSKSRSGSARKWEGIRKGGILPAVVPTAEAPQQYGKRGVSEDRKLEGVRRRHWGFWCVLRSPALASPKSRVPDSRSPESQDNSSPRMKIIK